jgi:hypothetical protein
MKMIKWIQDHEDVFTEIVLLGRKTWNDENIMNVDWSKIHRILEWLTWFLKN